MNDELSKNARTLLYAARHQGGPTTAQKAKLTVAVMTATAGTAAAMTTGAAATGTSLVKLVGAGVIATILGVSGTVLVKKAATPLPAPVTVPAAGVVRPVEPPRARAPAPQQAVAEPIVGEATPAPVQQPARAAPPPRVTERPLALPDVEPVAESATPELAGRLPPSRSVPSDTTAAEVTALGGALEALEEGRPADALQMARTARLAAPNGALRPELTVIEVEALCALQRKAEASELAASMPQSDRSPLVVQRLKRTCVAP